MGKFTEGWIMGFLKKQAEKNGLEGEVIFDVNDAIQAAKTKATTKDFIYIGGSTFVVAEIAEL